MVDVYLCNCTSAFKTLGRLLMQIDYDEYISKVQNSVCVCNTNCIYCAILAEIQLLSLVLERKGHFHYMCRDDCCRIICNNKDLITVIDAIAKRKCRSIDTVC